MTKKITYSLIFGFGLFLNSLAQNIADIDSLLKERYPIGFPDYGHFEYFTNSSNNYNEPTDTLFPNLKKLNKGPLEDLLPGLTLFATHLYWRYHHGGGQEEVLIIFDSSKRLLILSQNDNHWGINDSLSRMLIGRNIPDTINKKVFVQKLQELFLIGSTYKFENTVINNQLIEFDFVTSNPIGTTCTTRSHIQIMLVDNKILKLISNPIYDKVRIIE